MSDNLNDFLALFAAFEIVEWMTTSAMMIFWTGGLVSYFGGYRWQGILMGISAILIYWHEFS